jgi:hypothetical protein
MSDDDYWLEPQDDMGLWEHQGRPLTIRWLLVALREAAPALFRQDVDMFTVDHPSADLPIEIEWYDGTGPRRLTPVHIDVRALSASAAALVLTVS